MGKYSRFLRMLFFVFFLFYAVSPLSYTYTPKNSGDSLFIPDGPESYAAQFTIFVWELIGTKLGIGESEDHADSDVRILFRKARAILPEDVNKQVASQAPLSLHQASECPVHSSETLPVASTDKENPLQEFLPVFSGLSPPLV
jgi:hypothetical protein